jgi:PAS domain S-box-containing protein
MHFLKRELYICGIAVTATDGVNTMAVDGSFRCNFNPSVSMNWVTIIWSMLAAVCLTLALIHGLVWVWRRQAQANLLFALIAIATAGLAVSEWWMMRADTPEQFGAALRWSHVPTWVLVLSLVGFVRVYLGAGRRWLAWAICGVRTLSLILDFVFTPNLNYRTIIALRHVPFLGESVSVAEGPHNPWMLVGQVSFLLLAIFVVDATVTVWRRGERRKALLAGGSTFVFIVIGSTQAVLFLWGIVQAPITASLYSMGIVAIMGFELSRDLVRAAELSKELRESERRMSLAVDAANIGLWVRDLAEEGIWATAKWREIFAFTSTEPLSMDRFIGRLHPEDRDALRQVMKEAVDRGGSYEKEYRILLPDGRLRWISSRGRVESDGHGRPILMRGTSRDCSVRKCALEALQESEDRFRTMANTAPVMIWMSGTDKLCTFFNDGWLTFTGRTREQEMGNGWAEGVHRQDFDRCLDIYRRSFDARRPFEMEYRLRRSDGEYHWVLDRGTPRFSVEGSFLGYIGTCIDISARKLAEEAAHDLNGRLIHAQEEMQAQLARELHDDLSQSLALLAVELDMFGRSPAEQQINITSRMEEFSARVKHLTSEVHQLSHQLHPAKLQQLGLVPAVRGFCKEFAQAHELAIEFAERDVPSTVPPATALCLYRIVQEALHNVVKHSEGTMAKVELIRNGEQLHLLVADDGAGFDPQDLHTNSSLGLVSMSERARFVGGRLAIDSQIGAGTRVDVFVPVTATSGLSFTGS